MNGGGLGSASEDEEDEFENQNDDDDDDDDKNDDERKGLHLNWISNEDDSRQIFGTSADRRGRSSLDKASLLNRLVKREDVAKLFEGIEIDRVDPEKKKHEKPSPTSQDAYRTFLKCLARPEMRLIRRQMDSFVNKMLDERVTKGSAANTSERVRRVCSYS